MAGRFPLLLDEHVPRSLEQALLERRWTVDDEGQVVRRVDVTGFYPTATHGSSSLW